MSHDTSPQHWSCQYLPLGVLILNETLHISSANRRFCDIFDCSEAKLIGTSLEELFSPKDRKNIAQFYHKFNQYEQGFIDIQITLRLNRRDYYTRLRLKKIDEKWLAYVENTLIEQDLTYELLMTQERWNNIFKNAEEGIAILDADKKIVELNRRLLEIMKFRSKDGVFLSEDALPGKKLFELFKDQAFQWLEDTFEDIQQQRQYIAHHTQWYQDRYLETRINAMRLPLKGFVGCTIAFQDLTERQQAQEKQVQLLAKLQKTNAELATANQEILDLNRQLKSENLRMSMELDISRRLQQMMLPKDKELKQIKELDIAGFMEPAQEVGGDYYDVLPFKGYIKIGIGDVTGHGLESGVLALMVQTAVRTLLESQITDSKVFLTVLNRVIYGNLQRMNSECNLTLSLLDYCDGVLYLSGQHEEMLVVRQNGHIERVDTLDLGFPIGLEADISQFVAQTRIELAPNDGIVLYTDGITEAENTIREHYSIERLITSVRQHWHLTAQEIKQAVINDVRQYIGDHKVYDDITLLVIKRMINQLS